MSKQDRQGVRTPQDLERKYDFGQFFGSGDNSYAKLADQLNRVNQNLAQFTAYTKGKFEELEKDSATWIYSGAPTLENQPAVGWETEEAKEKHIGDFYYNTDTGSMYLFKLTDETYEWVKCFGLDYTVTFTVGGAIYEIVSVKSGNSLNAPTVNPTGENGTFTAWQFNGETVTFPFTPTEDTELSAAFE